MGVNEEKPIDFIIGIGESHSKLNLKEVCGAKRNHISPYPGFTVFCACTRGWCGHDLCRRDANLKQCPR